MKTSSPKKEKKEKIIILTLFFFLFFLFCFVLFFFFGLKDDALKLSNYISIRTKLVQVHSIGVFLKNVGGKKS